MAAIKDRVLLGTISGLLGAVLPDMLNRIEYRMGLIDAGSQYKHMASRIFTSGPPSPWRGLLGTLANETLNASVGVAATYALSATGRDNAFLKGMGIGALYWLGVYGLTRGLGMIPRSKKSLTPLLSFADHALGGGSIAVIASKLGDDSLFPDNKLQTKDERIPIMAF